MKTKLQKATYWASVSAIGIVVGISLQFVKAWTEPNSVAPNGNVAAPINVGGGSQTKSGFLRLDGGLRVGEAGNAYSYLTLSDDESTNGIKYVHANSDVIGFLSGGGSWLSYWDSNGRQHLTGNSLYLTNANSAFYGDGTNNATRQPGDFYVQNTAGNGYRNVLASDYYLASVGKWASSLGGAGSLTFTTVSAPNSTSATCTAGTTMVSGGCWCVDVGNGNDSSAYGGRPSGNGWECMITSGGGCSGGLTSYARCVQ